jgi:putative PIN family toxin of toxin-antitoxin system
VLDTNVVLDWLVFHDAAVDPLRDRIQDGRIVVLSNAHALEELRRVLGYPQFKLDAAGQAAVLDRYRSFTTRASGAVVPDDAERTPLPQGFPRCGDPHDDFLLALAYHAKADALVSKDKRVLKVRRRAAAFGFSVLSVPQAVAATDGAEMPTAP